MKVTSWTNWEDNRYSGIDDLSQEEYDKATDAVIKEIKEKGYKFSGSDHQNMDNCCPVIDDKYIFGVSMRSWGAIMQKAYDLPNEDGLGYVLWSWGVPNEEHSVYPTGN